MNQSSASRGTYAASMVTVNHKVLWAFNSVRKTTTPVQRLIKKNLDGKLARAVLEAF